MPKRVDDNDTMENCQQCGEPLLRRPKEGESQFASRRFCSQRCNGLSRLITSVDDPSSAPKYLRHKLRKRGIEIPKQRPGPKAPEFWSLVQKSNSCWFWQGGTNRDGYGVYHISGDSVMAHRHAWKQQGRELSDDAILMHKCDMPSCVNPDHLMVGTHSDNQADKTQKGRQAKGESIGVARLTETTVREIRSKYVPNVYTYRILAHEYGVCKDTVRKAVQGVYWRHVA